jgi:hypothetical protein
MKLLQKLLSRSGPFCQMQTRRITSWAQTRKQAPVMLRKMRAALPSRILIQ